MDINTCYETTNYYHAIAYYSHLVPVFLSLTVSIFVLFKSRFSFISKAFSLFVFTFCLWLIGDVIAWTSTNYDLVSAVWAPLDYINILYYLFGAYFFAVVVNEKDISAWLKLFLLVLSLPAWWITATNQSITAFYHPVCEAFNNEFLTEYKLWVEVIVVAFIMFYGFFKGRKASLKKKIQIATVCMALVLFFGVFSVTEYISSQTFVYEINLYSLFVLPVFLFIMIYSIVNFGIFEIRLIGFQVLPYILVLLVGSQFFFFENSTNKALTLVTFALSLGFGGLFIRSGKRETAAREKSEKLAAELSHANAKLKELDRQKDAVLHMVAHQLKGPVTTINFTTELLLDGTFGKLTHEQKENIEIISKASSKMGQQSGMVLDAAKITSGKLPLEPDSTDLNQLIKEVVEQAEVHAKEKSVKLKLQLQKDKLPIAVIDKKYTQIAFDNLLSNAVKYTALKGPGGEVTFKVELKKGRLYVTISDTGIGIPKADQDNVFQELFRASNAGKDGNGLGLHVAMGAIKAQGGKMWFESEEGKGTTFFVELPLKQEIAAKKKSSKSE